MADFFNGKDYGEYFEKLNNRLNSPEKVKPATAKLEKPVKKPKKGIYKTFHLRRSFYLGTACVLLALVLIIVLSARGCSSEKAENNGSSSPISGALTPTKAEKDEKIVYTEWAEMAEIPEDNDADSVIIVRRSDSMIVAQRDAHKRVHPASTLKIMTLICAVENITDFEDTFTMTLKITDPLFIDKASMAGFLSNEVVNMYDLLYGMILPSGAEAAMGLAVKIAGSEEAFVELMNRKATELGLQNTHFANVTGLHHAENYSTAYDMAVITDYAYRNELCRKVLSTFKYTTTKTTQNPKGIELKSTLFSHMYGTEPETATILGGKTGFVNEAGYCIASFGESIGGGESYIVVTMGNSSIWPAIHGQIALYKQFAK